MGTERSQEHTLEFLLTFNGRVHWYAGGYFVKFEIRRVAATAERPHGLRYSFTLHAPSGKRLLGFDNAHGVPYLGSRFVEQEAATDHWHRGEADPGRPYVFRDAATLVEDFFDEVRRVLEGRESRWMLSEKADRRGAMTARRIQSHGSLKQDMMAVARGQKPAPEDAAAPSFNSIEALMRLLTPDNRELLATIRDRKPQSIAELATLTGRAQPNLTRTLAKLEAVGFVRMTVVDRRKVPVAAVHRLRVEIDPFSQNDRLDMA